MTTTFDATRLDEVEEWSTRIHLGIEQNAARHDWCMATARALLDGTPTPASGYGTPVRSLTRARSLRATIRRLLAARPSEIVVEPDELAEPLVLAPDDDEEPYCDWCDSTGHWATDCDVRPLA